jgi:hypothetical protein
MRLGEVGMQREGWKWVVFRKALDFGKMKQ